MCEVSGFLVVTCAMSRIYTMYTMASSCFLEKSDYFSDVAKRDQTSVNFPPPAHQVFRDEMHRLGQTAPTALATAMLIAWMTLDEVEQREFMAGGAECHAKPERWAKAEKYIETVKKKRKSRIRLAISGKQKPRHN